MDKFGEVLKECSSKCLDCGEYGWCKRKTWVGEPQYCPKDKREKNDKEGVS